MNKSIFFKNANENYYIYDANHKVIVNSHPILLDYFNSQHNKKTIEEDLLKVKYGITETQLIHYRKKYLFLKRNGFFKKDYPQKVILDSIDKDTIDYSLSNCNNLVFQVTSACNLNCTYCCYGDLYVNSPLMEDGKMMSFETAKKIIDYFLPIWNENYNNKYNNSVLIGFYGGEPLMNFIVIKKIITYLKSNILTVKNGFRFSMTTNGLLLDKYMDYIVENNIMLLISLDGDRENNSYRVTKNNKSSFDKVFKNIKILKEKYPVFYEGNVSFNSVLNNRSTPSDVYSFFLNELNKKTSLNTISKLDVKEENIDVFRGIYQSMNDSAPEVKENDNMYIRKFSFFLYHYLSNSYRSLHDLLRHPKDEVLPTGTCLPFMKRIFILTSGILLPCERIPIKDSSLGKISEDVSINIDLIHRRYNNYYKQLKQQCSKCYMYRFCTDCLFQFPFKDGKYECQHIYNKQDIESFFSYHLYTLENDIKLYNESNNIIH